MTTFAPDRSVSCSDLPFDHDAIALAGRIAEGELSSSEALEAAIARCEKVNPEINAVCTLLIAVVTVGVLTAAVVNKRRDIQRRRDEQAAQRG